MNIKAIIATALATIAPGASALSSGMSADQSSPDIRPSSKDLLREPAGKYYYFCIGPDGRSVSMPESTIFPALQTKIVGWAIRGTLQIAGVTYVSCG